MLSTRLLSGLLLAICVSAQPASDLLQAGIFAQETRGDLDGAIRIYNQVLSSGAGQRLYAAQAQYRLGVCLLHKGDAAGALKAFDAVIKNYPSEHELVARAKENMPRGDGLLPAPWSQAEVSEYRWTIPGVDDGWSISRIAASAIDTRTLHLQMIFYGPQLNLTMIDTDRVTMRPILATYRGPSPENARTLEGSGVSVIRPSQLSKGAGYIWGELPYVLRRMAVADAWEADLPLVPPAPPSVHASVTGQERVTVPAGAFQCFKVKLSTSPGSKSPQSSSLGRDWPWPAEGETLWYATGGARQLVKIRSGVALGELTSLRTSDPAGSTSYRDSQSGYSFKVPAGWVYHSRTAMNGLGNSVDLIDPESQTVVIISGRTKETPRGQIEAELKRGAEDAQARGAGMATRSFEAFNLGGHQAILLIQDRQSVGRVAYSIWVQSEFARVSIRCQLDAVELDNFLRRFQPILDSFRIP